MTIETFKKRFDFPVELLPVLKQGILQAKNNKSYVVFLDRKNNPVAKLIKEISSTPSLLFPPLTSKQKKKVYNYLKGKYNL